MHSKTILVSCGRTITLDRASALFSSMDADVRALKVPPVQALSSGHGLGVDLLVIDDTDGGCDISAIEAELASGGDSALFLMLDESRMKSVRLPVRVTSDFACSGASDDEIKLRCRRLLWPGEMTSDADFIHMGALTVNLATYQVKVNGEPIDLTFMEYALAVVFGHASGTNLLARGAALPGVGLRLLRRQSHGRCACAPPAR